jgi:hypothetical protein
MATQSGNSSRLCVESLLHISAYRAGTGGLHPVENSHSRAEFQLSHNCVWRRMLLFVAAMGKIENCNWLGLTPFFL